MSAIANTRHRATASVLACLAADRIRSARMPSLLVRRFSAGLLCLLIVGCFFLSREQLRAEEVTAAFDAANKFYAEGKYMEAVGAYEKILETGRASSAIYFNLGNAFFKSGQIGHAIAAYRQAESISPRDPDLRANLQFARNQVQGPTLRPRLWESWLGRLSLNEWTWLASGAIWLTFALLTVRWLWPSVARSLTNWTWLAAVIAVLLTSCAFAALVTGSTARTAFIIVTEAAVRTGPFEESPNAFTVRDGAELRVLDRKGDWLQVTDGTRRVGWVKQDALVIPAVS